LGARLGDAAPDEIVGYHFEQAAQYRRELGAPDAALGARAADRLWAAARAARAREDVAAAANLLGRTAALLAESDPRLASALVEHGEALRQLGELPLAGDVFARSIALAHAVNESAVEWRARIGVAAVRIWREPEGAAQLALDEGNAAIAALPDDEHDVLARAWILLGDAALLRSQMAERMRTSEQALRHARAAGDRALEVEIIKNLAPAMLFGDVSVEDGMRYVDDVLARLGDVPGVRSFGLHVMGHLRARRGEFAEARQAIEEWRGHMKELGRIAQHANTAGCAYDVLSLAGDWSAAEREVREASQTLERMGDRASRSTTVAYLGVACFEQGKIDEADRCATLSGELGASDDAMNEAIWRSLRARVLAARGEREEAVAQARKAVEVADRTDYIDLQGDARRDLAIVLGAGPDGVRALDEAIARYERKGNRVSADGARALRLRMSGGPERAAQRQ
ncbi:MAG TPA: hypothetical protein VFV20_05125, partial [Candidatus Limnocylindria bacterium]|nr:hypothetical protein [Candidatus Limnocylindria bacterium]